MTIDAASANRPTLHLQPLGATFASSSPRHSDYEACHANRTPSDVHQYKATSDLPRVSKGVFCTYPRQW